MTVSRLGGYLSPLPDLRRSAVLKGFLGGNRGWMAIGLILWIPVVVRKSFGRTAETLSTEVLKPGQALRIEAIRTPTKAERRAARRAR
ncbi:MAG TPA: hypothetical protein VFE86_06150 [Ilumatobacteraceae bacterium]|nr:hypothetical protein [Ilumatobacteraceae bacterium]